MTHMTQMRKHRITDDGDFVVMRNKCHLQGPKIILQFVVEGLEIKHLDHLHQIRFMVRISVPIRIQSENA